jgi:hypothetical protein
MFLPRTKKWVAGSIVANQRANDSIKKKESGTGWKNIYSIGITQLF